MLKNLSLVGLATVFAVSTGCSMQQDTATIEVPQATATYAQSTQAAETEDSFWSNLMFWEDWSWGDEPEVVGVTAEEVRSDMSPELDTVAENWEEAKNRMARTTDTTTRQAWEDLGRFWLLDRPSRMTRYPIP